MLKRLPKKTTATRVAMPPPSSDTWSLPRPSALRESAIESSLFAIAIGEAFGMRYEGRLPVHGDRWKATIAKARIPRSHGLCTHFAISAGQALLECRSSPTQFESAFRKRVNAHRVARLPSSWIERVFRGGQQRLVGSKLGSINRLAPSIVLMSAVLQVRPIVFLVGQLPCIAQHLRMRQTNWSWEPLETPCQGIAVCGF